MALAHHRPGVRENSAGRRRIRPDCATTRCWLPAAKVFLGGPLVKMATAESRDESLGRRGTCKHRRSVVRTAVAEIYTRIPSRRARTEIAIGRQEISHAEKTPGLRQRGREGVGGGRGGNSSGREW